MEQWVAANKNLLASRTVLPAPVRDPSQRPLAPSVASVTSVANDKGDNEMILDIYIYNYYVSPVFYSCFFRIFGSKILKFSFD